MTVERLRILERMRAALGKEGEELQLVAVTASCRFLSFEAGGEAADARVDVPGWARHQSGAYRTGPGSPPVDGKERVGKLLFAEWALTRDKSVKVTPDSGTSVAGAGGGPRGELVEWTYGERLVSSLDQLGDGEIPALREVVRVLAAPVKRADRYECFVYHVFWGARDKDAPYDVRRTLARLAGVERRDANWRPKRRGG